MTVYDSITGEYLGCMGRERWERLLAEDAPATSSAPKNAYRAENKVIHVETPGIFHFAAPGCNETRCGRDMADARMTDHQLADQQPCVVCFENWDRELR